MTDHKQVKVLSPTEGEVEVDEGMVDFLRALWDRGIDTFMSCQENFPGISWVVFTEPGDAERFMGDAWEVADKKMRDRMEGELDVPGGWEFSSWPLHWGEGCFEFPISIRLPIKDKDKLAKLLALKKPMAKAG
jgi:hypothetical protein